VLGKFSHTFGGRNQHQSGACGITGVTFLRINGYLLNRYIYLPTGLIKREPLNQRIPCAFTMPIFHSGTKAATKNVLKR
jgi:hypothetical protein